MPKITDYAVVEPRPGMVILGSDDAGRTIVISIAALVGAVDADGVSVDRAAVEQTKQAIDLTVASVHELAAGLPAIQQAADLLRANIETIEAAVEAAEQLDVEAMTTAIATNAAAIGTVSTKASAMEAKLADARSSLAFGGGL